MWISSCHCRLSLSRLEAELEETGADPLALAKRLGLGVPVILRRMAALKSLGAGLVVCDRSGAVIFRKSIEGFTVPRFSSCCPLWPLFAALSTPGQVLQEEITQIGRAQARFETFAVSEALSGPTYNAPALSQGYMLLLPVPEGRPHGTTVGSTCRVCTQSACVARREPSILSLAPSG